MTNSRKFLLLIALAIASVWNFGMQTHGFADGSVVRPKHKQHKIEDVTQRLSERQRRRIYWEDCSLEDRAEVNAGGLRNEDEAQQEVSSGQVVLGDEGRYSEGKAARRLPGILKEQNLLEEKYHRQLCHKYHITDQERQAIVYEGGSKHWPLPPSPQ